MCFIADDRVYSISLLTVSERICLVKPAKNAVRESGSLSEGRQSRSIRGSSRLICGM
jgi:hypothetical protein